MAEDRIDMVVPQSDGPDDSTKAGYGGHTLPAPGPEPQPPSLLRWLQEVGFSARARTRRIGASLSGSRSRPLHYRAGRSDAFRTGDPPSLGLNPVSRQNDFGERKGQWLTPDDHLSFLMTRP